jgi:DNA-binding XRE family transcriptional regulator
VIIETWKDIPGHEAQYQVSDQGRVKSLSRYVRSGAGMRKVNERILRPGKSKSGHVSVMLGRNGHGSQVHQLVMLAFIGPPPKDTEVLHRNGNPSDNRLENLHYGTRSHNILDVYRVGKRWRKLSLEEIKLIHSRANSGETGTALAKEYGVTSTTVSAIKNGRYKSCHISPSI